MSPTTSPALARITGLLLLGSAIAFTAASAVLSATFDWPDVLRQPASDVLPAFEAGGPRLVWTWFAAGWTYGVLVVPVLLLPTVLDRRHDPALAVATVLGAVSVLLSLVGFLRWVFVVPPLATAYVTGDPETRTALVAAWTAQHQLGGALLGEHLGQVLAIAWSTTLSLVILRSRVLPRWLGVSGIVAGTLYLVNQGDVLASAVPSVSTWHTGGALGSIAWGLWVAALGAVLLRPHLHPVRRPHQATAAARA